MAKHCVTFAFKKSAIFSPKIGKNRRNGDNNIDPWSEYVYSKRNDASPH
jgi:hypothetical protein